MHPSDPQRRVSAASPAASARPSRRALLRHGAAALTGVLSGAALSGCTGAQVSLAPGQRLLTVWHPWGGVAGPRFDRLIRTFEERHPRIKIQPVYTQNTLSTNQKFFTAVAAGTPPDVTFVDGPQVASWAEWGALEPLDQPLRSAGIRADDYYPPTWRQNLYRDRVWALTYCADPNFAFGINREVFRSAGLDPDHIPESIEEVTELSDRLTVSRNGVIERIGLIPWAQYGAANSMFTWGWAFGGEFYDAATRTITADHPRLVRALEWMASFAGKLDPARIASLQQGFGTAELNPFYIGKMVMQCLVIGEIDNIARFAPHLDYGLGFIPAPPDGERRSAWVGGWCLAIPKGARNREDAWEFLRYLCHDAEGTRVVGREAGLFPGMRHSPYFDEVRHKPRYADYFRILETTQHQRPVMPVQNFYMRELERAVEAAYYGRTSPAEALAIARRNTQAELDLALSGS